MTLEAAKRGGVGNDMVDEVIMGNVLQAGLDQNPARQATVQLGGRMVKYVEEPMTTPTFVLLRRA